jgi:hypothetical protein
MQTKDEISKTTLWEQWSKNSWEICLKKRNFCGWLYLSATITWIIEFEIYATQYHWYFPLLNWNKQETDVFSMTRVNTIISIFEITPLIKLSHPKISRNYCIDWAWSYHWILSTKKINIFFERFQGLNNSR